MYAIRSYYVDEQHDRLMGKPNFDTQDPDAERIAGKVRRGFIKGASIGISFERNDLKKIDGKLVLTKCELIEVSIVITSYSIHYTKLYELCIALLTLLKNPTLATCIIISPRLILLAVFHPLKVKNR